MAPAKDTSSLSIRSASTTPVPATTTPTSIASAITNAVVNSVTQTTSIPPPAPTTTTTSAVASATPTAFASATLNAFASATPTASSDNSSSGLSTVGKVVIGVIAAVVVLGLIFCGTVCFMKRKARAMTKAGGSGGNYSETPQHDLEDHVLGDAGRGQARKSDDLSWLKGRGRRNSSLGSHWQPGLAEEEAYMMFGGSRTSVDAEREPLQHSRRHSETTLPSKYSASRVSLSDDSSRYPMLGGETAASSTTSKRLSRQSVSYAAGVDLFSDADRTPRSGSPTHPPLNRAVTTGDITESGTVNPKEARRVSLTPGVGARPPSRQPSSSENSSSTGL